MITLIYGSTAVRDFSDAELLDILTVADEKNKKLGITGMLLYKNKNFLQVLEGEAEVVDALYAKIQKDPRHHSVMTILRRKIKEREFGNWTMSFVNLDTLEAEQQEGFTNFLIKPFDMQEFTDEPSYAFAFLRNFKELMR